MAGRKAGKYKQTVRCLKLLDRLRSVRNGVEIDVLAEEFEVTSRQVYRDLEALELAGFESDKFTPAGEHVHVRLVDPPLKAVQLGVRERYALLAVRRVFDVLEGTPLYEDVRAIYHKLVASMPANMRGELEEFGERFVYLPDGGTKRYAKKEDILNDLLTGVLRRLRVDFEYVRADGKKRRGILEPFAMVLYRQGLYILGRPAADSEDPGQGAIRLYATERFTRAKFRKGDGFEVPQGFKVDKFFHGVFGIFVGGAPTRVVVEFSAAVHDAVAARRWHPDQKLTKLAKGKQRLTFEVPNTAQIVPWVLSWGDHARIVEPEALAGQVRGIVKRMGGGGERTGLSQPPPPLAL